MTTNGEYQERRQYLHDRIGGLCTRYMTLVGPLSGGVVEQAYRLRDEIMAVLDATDIGRPSDG